MIKYQNYSHYKLPITVNPVEYGKLIEQIGRKYIIQLNSTNVLVINERVNENFIKLFRKGEFIFEFNDLKINDNTFIRTISDQKYTFKDSVLISTEIISAHGCIKIYPLFEKTITPLNKLIKYFKKIYEHKKAELFILFELFLIFLLYFICFVLFPEEGVNISAAGISNYNIIKLRKTRSLNIWKTLEFNINNLVFTNDLFLTKFDKFWETIKNNFLEDNHMFVLFKIKYKGTDYATIGKLQRLNVNDKDWFFNWILNTIEFKSEYYKETQIESFVFSYGFKDGLAPIKEKFKENVSLQNYKNNKIPISYNPLDYGKIITTFKYENYTHFVIQTKEGNLINFKQFDKYNEIEIFNKGNIVLSYKDEFISENKFIRILDNKKHYFENNIEILFLRKMKTKFISKLSAIKNFKNKFITLDIETFNKENILIPYLIRFYDGINCYSYWLGNYSNVEEMILDCFKDILIRKYNRSNVYIHNLAKFDIIFLLKYLVKLGVVQPVIHNQRIISINLNYGLDNKYQINFRDSYLILLSSLRSLCKCFNVKNPKTMFPHLFVNENNLNYVGLVPDFKYFTDVSKKDYIEYCKQFNNNWSLKIEAEKYCELDCKSLHQVISNFGEMVFNLFGKSIHHYPTLPSLAFAIFRAKFMSEENIPQLSGKIAKDIRSGYTGGAVDMYIPENPDNTEVFGYDVNSLYPSQMHSQEMPIGTPNYFEGDIRLLDSNAFGFFYCKIIAPDNLDHPVLQTHVKTGNGIRTIAPLGTWEDMIFSKEMDNAIKIGYQFEILWGYTFDSAYIFDDYVSYLYNFRLNYPKSDPLNFLAKILLNSLYGRFGMDDNFAEVNIINKDYYLDFENKYLDLITETKDLGDYKLVIYKTNENQIENEKATHNVSIAIASAITAYSRIHMSQFKNNPNFTLYYTDTDSVYIDKPLDDYLIDSKTLGKLKLENTCTKAIFLSPKVYCLETIDDKFIYKVKGLSHETELSIQDFKNLLFKDAFIEKTHTKWFRSLSNAEIKLLEQVYTLKVTENKRRLIYKKGKLIGTIPYIINENKEILN